MLVTQYTHRLPAGYDMTRIRERASVRGPDWDNYPGLIFKGFLLREKGKLGAIGNVYSSLYLWETAEAFAAFIAGRRFQDVIDAFGRPQIETFAVLACAFGPSRHARFVQRVDELVPMDANLAALNDRETKTALESASIGETFAAVTAADVKDWRLSRYVLSQSESGGLGPDALTYEAAYLAKPGRR
ncbi:MAG: DUF4865 family protein [Rhodomicrobium sp.]